MGRGGGRLWWLVHGRSGDQRKARRPTGSARRSPPAQRMTGVGPISLVGMADGWPCRDGGDGNHVLCVRAMERGRDAGPSRHRGRPLSLRLRRAVHRILHLDEDEADRPRGRTPARLANVSDPRGGTGARRESSSSAPNAGSALLRISASGGEATTVTRLDPGQPGNLTPLASLSSRRSAVRSTMNRSLRNKDRLVLEIGSSMGTNASGWSKRTPCPLCRWPALLPARNDADGANFEARSLRLSGEHSAVLDAVWRNPANPME